ncbi:hypothetical protein GOODEAATRI_006433 [Goodea atripinnis]|uniref:Uncharacterized protein n=1 Tax=Goodea atripinnis TaxID=208336 RepID=A0ABV0NIC6_9TELE
MTAAVGAGWLLSQVLQPLVPQGAPQRSPKDINSWTYIADQSTGDTPTTPKHTKEHRDIFFPASLTTPVLLSHSACHPLSTQDGQAKGVCEPLAKMSRPQSSGFHDQPQQRRTGGQPAAAMAFLPPAGTVA